MVKKSLIIIAVLLSIVLVSAALVGNIIDADFISPNKPIQTKYIGNITFKANGKPAQCELSEPNMDIDDDFEECLARYYPNMKITDVVDWEGRKYKQITINNVIYKSFDENKLEGIKREHIEVNPV